MERERIEEIVGEQSTAQRLMPLKNIDLVLASGVVLLFALGTFCLWRKTQTKNGVG